MPRRRAEWPGDGRWAVSKQRSAGACRSTPHRACLAFDRRPRRRLPSSSSWQTRYAAAHVVWRPRPCALMPWPSCCAPYLERSGCMRADEGTARMFKRVQRRDDTSIIPSRSRSRIGGEASPTFAT
eukprot:3299925-Pyramimonas_sp.AAC.1